MLIAGVSAAAHVIVLGAFSLRPPPLTSYAALPAMEVSLVTPLYVRPRLSVTAPQPDPPSPRLIALAAEPRHAAAAEAPTGEAGDVVDLFGPVFADGLWPRPVVVRRGPCDPDARPDDAETCRRELVIIGLASETVAGSNAPP